MSKNLTDAQKKIKYEKTKLWQKNNPDKCKEHSRRTRNKHKLKTALRKKKWATENRDRVLTSSKTWHDNNKDRQKNNILKKQFGITLVEYNELLKLQNEKCAICGTLSKNNRSLSVDHSHTDGKVRGLLCTNCNIGIGNFRDSIKILKKALKYCVQ